MINYEQAWEILNALCQSANITKTERIAIDLVKEYLKNSTKS